MGCTCSNRIAIIDKKKKSSDTQPNEFIINNYKLNLSKESLSKYNKSNIKDSYIMQCKLDSGSFGIVYKARHILTNDIRAIKAISRNKLIEQDQRKVEEIKIMCQLDHPHIVKIYEYFTDEENFYISMEYLQGGNLIDKLEEIDILDEYSVCCIMEQLLSCVHYLHLNNIVHRDLKLENILLEVRRDLDIKLIDFGLATYYKNKRLIDLCGSSYYIAPEVLDLNYDNKCDIWSCGIIMYFLLSGSPPFLGNNVEELYENIKSCKYKFDSKIWSSVSEEAIDLIKKMIQPDPNKRISAQDALNHKWIKNKKNKKMTINRETIPDLKNNLKRFLSKNLLQLAFDAFIVHHSSNVRKEKELRDFFKKIDTSNDGRLSFDELRDGYKKYLKDPFIDNHIEEVFKAMNSDGSEFIEYEEFLRASSMIDGQFSENQLTEAFKHYDMDGSGKISADELKQIIGFIKDGKDKDEIVRQLIEKMDINGDGEISLDEFKLLVRSM